MPFEVVENLSPPTIPAKELKPGQVAVIVGWAEHLNLSGAVVQCRRLPHQNGTALVILGEDNGWTPTPHTDDFRVRVLPRGTVLRYN